jgi:hypothetical protein
MDLGHEPSRMVLVTRVDQPTRTVGVVLLSPETDLWTDTDILLKGEETGLAFDLLLQTELVGPLFWSQLGHPVGRLDAKLLDELIHALEQHPDNLAGRRGLPIRDQADLRWAHKQSEAETLGRLVRSCGTELVDPVAPEIHPDVFADAVEHADERVCRALLGDVDEPLAPLPVDLLPGPPAEASMDRDVENLVVSFQEASLAHEDDGPPDRRACAAGVVRWSRPAPPRLSDLVGMRAAQGRKLVRVRTVAGAEADGPSAAETEDGRIQVIRDERAVV